MYFDGLGIGLCMFGIGRLISATFLAVRYRGVFFIVTVISAASLPNSKICYCVYVGTDIVIRRTGTEQSSSSRI